MESLWCRWAAINSRGSFLRTVHSGVISPKRVDSAEECAGILRSAEVLGVDSGMVVAVPVRAAEEQGGNVIEDSIRKALWEVEYGRIGGRDAFEEGE